jgi:predicted alpha/beta hydrolase family esterase
MLNASGRKIFIFHGISATARDNWYSKVADHFRALGYDVLVPNMPHKHTPNLNEWSSAALAEIKNKGWTIDENLSMIGHSTGSLAVMRFIEKLPEHTRIGPSILVAGFPAAFLHPKFPTLVARPPRVDLIRPKLSHLLAVHSTNDWRVPLGPNSRWFEKELSAEIFTIGNAGHVIKRHGWGNWSDELYCKAEQFLSLS